MRRAAQPQRSSGPRALEKRLDGALGRFQVFKNLDAVPVLGLRFQIDVRICARVVLSVRESGSAHGYLQPPRPLAWCEAPDSCRD